jgi:hypothetical protein
LRCSAAARKKKGDFVALQRGNKRKKEKATSLRCNATTGKKEEGDGSHVTVAWLSSPSLLRCKKKKGEGDFVALQRGNQKKKKEGDGNVAAIAFFVVLQRNASRKKKKGDSNVAAIAFFVALQLCNAT